MRRRRQKLETANQALNVDSTEIHIIHTSRPGISILFRTEIQQPIGVPGCRSKATGSCINSLVAGFTGTSSCFASSERGTVVEARNICDNDGTSPIRIDCKDEKRTVLVVLLRTKGLRREDLRHDQVFGA